MNARKYVLSVLVCLALVIVLMYATGGSLGVYVDFISLVLGIGLPLMLLKAGWSFREMGRAFRSALSGSTDRRALEDARLFFATARWYALFSGALSFVFGFIVVFRYLDDPSKLGRNISVNLICLFYTLLVSLLLCLPLESAAKRKLLDLP